MKMYCLYYQIRAFCEKEDCPQLDRGSLRPPICPATFDKKTFAPITERLPKYRGARTEVIGKISDTANSAVVCSTRYA
jgi:hypothetical protein